MYSFNGSSFWVVSPLIGSKECRNIFWLEIYWVPQILPQIYTVIEFVLLRLRDLQYIFAVIYETRSIYYKNCNLEV